MSTAKKWRDQSDRARPSSGMRIMLAMAAMAAGACEVPMTPAPVADAAPSCETSCLDVCPDEPIAADGTCMRCAGGAYCAVLHPCAGWCDEGALQICDESGTNCLCQIPSGGRFACAGSGR